MVENRLIGEILIQMGYASRDLIIECLNAQMEVHRMDAGRIPLGTLLLKTGHVTSDQLDKALAQQAKYRMLA